jgi:superfamily II helicase
MKTIVTYITEDGKTFDNVFEAKRHECELTTHRWEFYNKNMGLQKTMDEQTHLKFCKHCSKQELMSNCSHNSTTDHQDKRICNDCGHTTYGDFR